jgi:hypothetical protein
MVSEHYAYMNDTSIILGIIGLLVCLYGDIPKPYGRLLVWTLPALVLFNYWTLNWLSEKRSAK